MFRFLLFAMLAAPMFGEIPETVLAEHDLQKRSGSARCRRPMNKLARPRRLTLQAAGSRISRSTS